MMRLLVVALTLALWALCPVSTAAAQEWRERMWITADGGIQSAGSTFSDAFEVRQFTETGTVKADYPTKASPVAGGSVGIRIWKRFGAGVAVTRVTRRGSASVDARVPHPFFDNQFRTVRGTTSVSHSEVGAHLQLSYLMNVTPRLRMILSAGPSVLSVEQTLVTDVQFSQEYPFDTATFTGATTRLASTTASGFNAAADAFWMVGRTVGAGGVVRFTRATAKESAGNGRTVTIDAGGVQAGVGLRVMF